MRKIIEYLERRLTLDWPDEHKEPVVAAVDSYGIMGRDLVRRPYAQAAQKFLNGGA